MNLRWRGSKAACTVRIVTPEVKSIGFGAMRCDVGKGKSTNLEIRDVLYVLSLGSTLLSVKKLTKDGYKLVFEKVICHIEKKGKPQAAEKLSLELYKIQTIE